MTARADLEAALEAICRGEAEVPFDYAAVPLREALPAVAARLRQPMDMDRAERIEWVFKRYLRAAFAVELSGDDARFIAAMSRKVGFVLKFKPYGVKCATALGYSIFFLRPGMGFSFQRHRTRKTELFHMLKTLDRGQVYLSTSKEWDACYDKDEFNRWLAGTPDPRYAAYSRRPEPGDVYLVTELDTVHSVLGCVLEEYATVSTDMVDRLHDQNDAARDGVPIIPAETVDAWLADLPRPLPGECWKSLTAPPLTLARSEKDGIVAVVLADTGEFLAERFEIAAGAVFRREANPTRAVSLFCLGGKARIELFAAGETGAVEPVTLKSGEVIIVGPKLRIAVRADEKTSISAHTIRPELALD